MGKSDPQPPAAPDPTATANAQAQANITAANATAALNRVNQASPTGNIQWTQDPTTGQWSQSTSLTQAGQGVLNSTQGIAQNAANTLGANIIAGQPNLATSFSNPGVPVSSVSNPGVPVSSLNLSGIQPIPTADDAAYNQSVDAAYNQATSRLDPQWAQQQTQLETQLANQGVTQNSDAWNKAMTQFQQGKTDAYNTAENTAVQTGSALEQAQFGMGLQANQAGVSNALTEGDFANSAAGQQLAQALSTGNFANSAAGQQYAQNAGEAQFGNTAANQNFTNSNTNLQNLEQEIGLPNAVSSPSFPGVAGATVAAPDVLGAQSLSTQSQLAEYQQQMQNNAAKKSGTGSTIGTVAALALLA